MRRSVAPSQLNSSPKRPRFCSPLAAKTNPTYTSLQKTEPSVQVSCASTGRSTLDVLKLIKGTSTENEFARQEIKNTLPERQPKADNILKPAQVSCPRVPDIQFDSDVPAAPPNNENENQITNDGSRYFNVVWCKLSKKKHKKWEGDAVLIVRGRTATLRDLDGKEIGRAVGYRLKDVENLEDGSTLPIGGKEVEIMGLIKEDDYRSGRCFQSLVDTTPEPVQVKKNFVKKPFLHPVKPSASHQVASSLVITPMFDPTNPNALVMPRPSQALQWQFNKQNLPVVDVVVDPCLSQHLRPHQKEGVIFLYECLMSMRSTQGLGAILADEMGLGKTLQCITVIWTLLKQGPYGGRPESKKVLIITPSSLVQNWVKEFHTWLGKNRIVLYAVDTHNKAEDFQKLPCCPVMIISYEMFVRAHKLIQSTKFDLVVCDEGHRLKNSSIKTTTLISSLQTRRRILLTGTPVQNDLQEFFSIVEFCNPGILGSLGSFRHIYEDPIVKSRQPQASSEVKSLGESRAAELARLTTEFTLRRTQEIINKYLPPKVENVVFCRPTSVQLCALRCLLKSPSLRSCFSNPDGSAHLACIAALKKVCNHPYLVYKVAVAADIDASMHESSYVSLYEGLLDSLPDEYKLDPADEAHSGKMCVLKDFLSSLASSCYKEKVVIVSNYTQTLDLLQQMCNQEGYPFLRLDGATPTRQRQSIVESFNSPHSSHFVFLLSTKAGGVGLNLIGASRILLYDIDWNPANDLQAMSRVWRDGQTKQVHVYRLLTAGTIEEKIFQRQIKKQDLSITVVDRNENAKVRFTTEELKDLFKLHEDADCITHDLLHCDCLANVIKEVDSSKISAPAVKRNCQLTFGKVMNRSNMLSMSELNDWQHYKLPSTASNIKDEHLLSAVKNITFVLQNRVGC